MAILWLAIMFVLSSQPGTENGRGPFRFGTEKVAHLVVFGILGLLAANALTTGMAGTTAGYASFLLLSGSRFARRAVTRRPRRIRRPRARASAIRPAQIRRDQ